MDIQRKMQELQSYVLSSDLGTLFYQYVQDRNWHVVITDISPKQVAELVGAELKSFEHRSFSENKPKSYYMIFPDSCKKDEEKERVWIYKFALFW